MREIRHIIVFSKPYHGREHASQAPHVQAIIVLLEIHEKLWALEIT